MGLLLAKFTQKTFLIDVSVIPRSHFKFRSLEKMLTFLEGTWRLIFWGMVSGTFHHQNTLAEEWSRNWDTRLYYEQKYWQWLNLTIWWILAGSPILKIPIIKNFYEYVEYVSSIVAMSWNQNSNHGLHITLYKSKQGNHSFT